MKKSFRFLIMAATALSWALSVTASADQNEWETAIGLPAPWIVARPMPTNGEHWIDQLVLSNMLHKFGTVKDRLDLEGCNRCELLSHESFAPLPMLAPNRVLQSDSILFATHSSSKWDISESIQHSLNFRIREAINNKTTVVYLVDPYSFADLKDYFELYKPVLFYGVGREPGAPINIDESFRRPGQDSYFQKYKPSFLYLSGGGSHELKLMTKKMYFTGGFFDYCAGETARDAILGAMLQNGGKSSEPIRAIYLTDALYIGNWTTGKSETLQSRMAPMSDEQVMDFLQTTYFGGGTLGKQQSDSFRRADFKDFTFKILRNGKVIGTLGSGSVAVEMDFQSR